MDVRTHHHTVMIDSALATVGAYVGDARNLPHWTRFFLHVGEETGGTYAASTVLGPARTWIEAAAAADRQRYVIHSIIKDRLERADVSLLSKHGRTEVTFTLRLPAALPAEQTQRQVEILRQELSCLKQHLEEAA